MVDSARVSEGRYLMETCRLPAVLGSLLCLCLACGTAVIADAEGSRTLGLNIGLSLSIPALSYGDFATFVGPLVGVVAPLSERFALGAWTTVAFGFSGGSPSLQASVGPTLVLGNTRTLGLSISPGAGLFLIGGWPRFFLDVRGGLFYRDFFAHLAWVAWPGSGVKVDAGYTLHL